MRRKITEKKIKSELNARKIQKIVRGFLGRLKSHRRKNELKEIKAEKYLGKEILLLKAKNDRNGRVLRKVLRASMPLRYAFGEKILRFYFYI